MKNLRAFTLVVITLVFSSGSFAVTSKATLKTATIYFNGAELTHKASVFLNNGENEVSIEGLSPQIDQNSLNVKVNNGVMVTSTEFSVNYLEPAKENPTVKLLRDSLELYQVDLNKVASSLKINKDLLLLLRKGVETNLSLLEKGSTVADISSNMDLYKTKATALDALISTDTKAKDKIDKQIARISNQLQQELGRGGKNTGVLKLTLSAPAASEASITVSYFTTAASWTPYYDINVVSSDKPIKILGKSKVRQTTGLDWNQVLLTLSTANPTFNKNASFLNTWFLDYIKPTYQYETMLEQSPIYSIQSDQMVTSGYRTTNKKSDASVSEPLYLVDYEVVSAEYAKSLNPNFIKSTRVINDNEILQKYGAQARNGVVEIITKSIEDFITQTDRALTAEYKLDMPYTIPGNGKEQSVDLKSYETAVTLNYYCAPKLDSQTYLLAEISDWNKLNLLSGKANVSFEGSYVGETTIDVNSTEPKLKLTLGSDKRVTVTREKVKDFSTVKTFGQTTKMILTYKLTIKNNQTKAIHAVLKDQYPISTNKDIVVELLKETSPACENNKETGIITWELDLEPGASETYTISYSVQYPKGSRLNLE